MSLQARLTGAVAGNASRKRNRRDVDPTTQSQQSLIPFSILQSFLQDQPIIQESNVDVRTIHSVLVSMHTHLTAPPDDARANPGATPASPTFHADGQEDDGQEDDGQGWQAFAPDESPAPPIDRTRCSHCDVGRYLLDEHEGMFFCNNCGVVETRRSVNVQPEFQAAPVVGPRQRGRPRLLSGVADWVVARTRAEGGSSTSARDFMEDLEHWNVYTGHGVDVLRGLGRALAEWNDPGHTRLARAVTALLWPLIREQIPDGTDIRDMMRRGVALPEVRDRDAEARLAFACDECGETVESRRGARFHCPRGSRQMR